MGSRGIKVVLATVGVLTLASVGQAVPAGAALTPVVYGFGSNQAGEPGNGTTTPSQALNAAGLVFGSVTYVVDYTCTNIGTVTWQSPAAGTRVNRGAAVSIRIGTAPRPPRECL